MLTTEEMLFTHEQKPNPLNAVLFAKVFENEDSALSLRGFLNAVLENSGDPLISEITVLKSEVGQFGDSTENKATRLDVLAQTEDGERVNIEVQLQKPMEYNMIDRSLFYASGLMRGSIDSGEGYEKMPRVIMVNLLGYDERESGAKYHQPIDFVYRLEPRVRVSDRLSMHNIEMPKFLRLNLKEYTTNLEKWLYALSERGVNNPEKLKAVIGVDEALRQYLEHYEAARTDVATDVKWRAYDKTYREHISITKREKALTEGEKALTEGEKALAEKEKIFLAEKKAASEKEKALAAEKNALAEKEKAASEKEQKLFVLAEKMGLSEAEIQKLLGGSQPEHKEIPRQAARLPMKEQFANAKAKADELNAENAKNKKSPPKKEPER